MADLIITVGKKKQWEISFPMLGLTIVYLFFTIMDLTSSAQTGNKNSDRTIVHIALICLTVYLLAYIILHVRRVPKSGVLCVLFLMAVWIFLTSMLNGAALWTLLVQMNMSVLWVLSFLFFWFYTGDKIENGKRIQKFCGLLTILYLGATAYYSATTLQQYGHFVAMNVVYYSLAILPWFFADIDNRERSIRWIIATATVMISLKRGAIIALPVMYICEMFEKGKQNHNGKKIAKLLLMGSLFVAAFFVADQVTDGFMSHRFSKEGLEGGSGRIGFYMMAINAMKQRNAFQLLIGGGAGSSVALIGTGVHNEWLEMLFSYGLIGLMLYTALIVSFITTTVRIYKTVPKYGPCCLMSLGLYLILSMVSTGYGGYSGIFLFGFWGYIESLENRRLKEEHEKDWHTYAF